MNDMSNDNNTQEHYNEPAVITEVKTEAFPGGVPADTIEVRKIMMNYVRHWYWFAISLAVCGFCGWFYLHKKSPVYLIKSIVMLNQGEDESASLSSLSAMAMQFGFGGASGSSANIYDEMTRLRSDKLLSEVVGILHLNETSWQNVGFFKPKSWYFEDSPFAIRVPQSVLDTLGAITRFDISVKESGNVHLKVRQQKKKVLDTEIKGFPFTVKTPAATFVIDTTSCFKKGKNLDFHSIVMGTPLTVYELMQILSIDEVDKKGNAIYQDISAANVPRGEAILNTITSTYINGRLTQQLARRKEALEFIEGRLMNLYAELEQSENKIEAYKRDNKIVDAEAEAEYIFTRKGAIEGAATQTRTEMEIYTMLRDMLSSPDTKYSLLPFATSAGEDKGSSGLATAIGGYNDLILKRMELTSGLKGSSAQLERIDEQLTALRENILTTLTREIQSKKIALAAVESENSISNSRMSDIPTMEKKLTQLYRDREVKNAIYAFLLQKREEAEIAVQQVEPIGEIIDPAYAEPEPRSPKPLLAYAIALFMGLVIPLILVKWLCAEKPGKKGDNGGKTRTA